MTLPRLCGISISLALHVAVLAAALILIWEPAPPPALFIDLTHPLDVPPMDGGAASSPAAAVSSPPVATSAPRRAAAPRDSARPRVASAPSTTSELSASPTAPPRAEMPEPPVAASPPAPTEVPASPSPVLAPPSPAASPSPARVLASPSPAASPSPPPSAPAGGTATGGVEAVTRGSEIGSSPSAPGLETFAPSSAGTDTGRTTTGGDQRGAGTTALAWPGDGGRAGSEYAAYLALVRRRIQESLRYPVVARRRGLTGSVHVEITVEPTGRIAAVSLVTSSSHPLLDEAALEAVRSLPRVPFPSDLTPRTLRVRLPVIFELR